MSTDMIRVSNGARYVRASRAVAGRSAADFDDKRKILLDVIVTPTEVESATTDVEDLDATESNKKEAVMVSILFSNDEVKWIHISEGSDFVRSVRPHHRDTASIDDDMDSAVPDSEDMKRLHFELLLADYKAQTIDTSSENPSATGSVLTGDHLFVAHLVDDRVQSASLTKLLHSVRPRPRRGYAADAVVDTIEVQEENDDDYGIEV